MTSLSNLLSKAKWNECAALIRKELENSLIGTSNDDEHILRISLENNLFVFNQLGKDWDSNDEANASQDWALSYLELSELYQSMRCQNICSGLPLELVLTISYNSLWWTCMKVDPLNQHACVKESLKRATFALETVGSYLGVWNPEDHMRGVIDSNFSEAIRTVAPVLIKLPSILCQLCLEIMILGCLIFLDQPDSQCGDIFADYQDCIQYLVDSLPQFKVHFLCGHQDSLRHENIIKFGWQGTGTPLGRNNASHVVELLLFTKAIFKMKISVHDSKEEIARVVEDLRLIDSNHLTFPFMYHYLCAFAHFKLGKLDSSLYHLQLASSSSCNVLMQSRANILKGEILLLQNKPSLALQSLMSVEYKCKEVRVPFCAYLIGRAYQSLRQYRRQIETLNLLLEYLSAQSVLQPTLLSPFVGVENRLLLSVHLQPEVTVEEVLQSCGVACLMNERPEEAAEKFLALLKVLHAKIRDDVLDICSMWKVSQQLHDTASVLLKAESYDDAQIICEAALEFYLSGSDRRNSVTPELNSLGEDVISLMLLAEAKNKKGTSDVAGILNRCGKLLQGLMDRSAKFGGKNAETVSLCGALLARVFLQKALLNLKRSFNDDAVACFQRALHVKHDDHEVILQFSHYLLESNQVEESMVLWSMYKESEQSSNEFDSIALNHILGQKMSQDLREETLCRLKSLDSPS